jgi:hypothetical protein
MIEDEWMVPHVCRTLFNSNGIKMNNLVENWNDNLNLRPDRTTRESGASSDGKDGEWYVDIQSFKVVASACID